MNKRLGYIIDVVFVALIGLILIVGYLLRQNKNEALQTHYDFLILEENNEVSALYTDGSRVYVGTNKGLDIYDVNSKTLTEKIESVKMTYAAGIIGDGAGGIWLGHESGLTHIYVDGEQVDYTYPLIPKGRVNTVAMRDNKVYCGTYNGAAVLERNISEGDMSASSDVDKEWKVVSLLDKSTGLLCDSVNVIFPVESGIFYFSYLDMEGGATFIGDDGSITYYDSSSGLPHPYTTSVIEDDDGNIWVGSGYMRDGGLVKLQKSENSYVVLPKSPAIDDIPGEKVRFLYMDEKSFWITTEYDGVLIKIKNADKDWTTSEGIYLTEENGLSDNEIKCIIGTDGEYWLGGKYGLTIVPKDYIK